MKKKSFEGGLGLRSECACVPLCVAAEFWGARCVRQEGAEAGLEHKAGLATAQPTWKLWSKHCPSSLCCEGLNCGTRSTCLPYAARRCHQESSACGYAALCCRGPFEVADGWTLLAENLPHRGTVSPSFKGNLAGAYLCLPEMCGAPVPTPL